MSTISIRRLACIAGLALTVLAGFGGSVAAGSGAQGDNALVCTARAQQCMTAPEFRALMIRSLALNHKYGLGE
jgi:hypothetical protein